MSVRHFFKAKSSVEGQATKRKMEGKIQAMDYSISPPISKSSIPLPQHPFLRHDNDNFDSQYRPQRSQTDMSLQPGNGAAGLSRQSSSEIESPVISPTLKNYLRPEGGYHRAESQQKFRPSKPLPSTEHLRSPKTQNALPSAVVSDGHSVLRKRSRDLDYSISQLTEMDYQKLKDESFIPANTISQRDLPDRNLSLSDQLQMVFNDKVRKDKASYAMVLFVSLTIEQYEECGDLLLDKFQNIIGRLKGARQQKRKAVKAIEEQIAKREECVRKKRGVCELELGRLKNTGAEVVKSIKSKAR